MTISDSFLLCFAVGALWTLVTWLLGGFHFGHGHTLHVHHGHGSAAHHAAGGAHHTNTFGHWIGCLVNPSSIAVFFTWFGGVGYLLTRHTGLRFWSDLAIAAGFGLVGAWLMAAFLRFLQAREKPLDPADYQMIGTLGRVSCAVRPGGTGELIYVRDGARKLVPVRSEDGQVIPRGVEAIVTRFEKGIAYIRTWDAMVTETGHPTNSNTLKSGN